MENINYEEINEIFDISTKLVELYSLEEKIDLILSLISKKVEVEAAYVFRINKAKKGFNKIYQWVGGEEFLLLGSDDEIHYAEASEWERELLDKQFINYLPDEFLINARKDLIPENVLVFPILIDGRFTGIFMIGLKPGVIICEYELKSVLSKAVSLISLVHQKRLNRERYEKLEISYNNFRNLFENYDEPLIIANLKGEIVYNNRAVKEVFGYSDYELEKMTIFDFHSEKFNDELRGYLSKIIEDEKADFTVPIISKNRVEDLFHIRGSLGTWNNERCIFFVAKNVTEEQKKIRKFIHSFNHNPVAMVICDLNEERILDINQTFIDKTGYSRGELIATGCDELGIYVDSEQRREMKRILVKEGKVENLHMKLKSKSGKIINGLVSGGIISQNFDQYSLLTIVDVTEQLKLINEITLKKKKLENIINGTDMGTWEWNISTGEIVLNERWANILGYELNELEPASIQTWIGFTHPEDLRASNEKLIKHFKGELDNYEFEIRMKSKNDDWVWVLSRGKVIEWDEENKPLKMFGVNTDITSRKHIEEKVRKYAIMDNHTDIYNRRYVFERLEELNSVLTEEEPVFSVSILDIDHFKTVNDTIGHLGGDFVLKRFAEIVKEDIRKQDIFGRYGGEEFIIVSINSKKEQTVRMVERILSKIGKERFEYNGQEIRITFSAGISDSIEIPRDEFLIEKMLETADERLYLAKKSGRNRVIIQKNKTKK